MNTNTTTTEPQVIDGGYEFEVGLGGMLLTDNMGARAASIAPHVLGDFRGREGELAANLAEVLGLATFVGRVSPDQVRRLRSSLREYVQETAGVGHDQQWAPMRSRAQEILGETCTLGPSPAPVTRAPGETPDWLQKRFMFICLEANDPGQFCTLDELIHDNYGDHEEFCQWARTAEPGQSYTQGGGAAPTYTTWRVA